MGFEFSSALLDVAADYPGQYYFVSSFIPPTEKVPSNIMFVNIGYFDASYAAGALAALISDRKRVVGFVGGEDDPKQQQKMKLAFIAGAQRTVPGIKGIGIMTGDYNNAAKGREAASTLVGNGADVIWHAADITGLGAIQGAAAAGVKVIGCYSDQTSLAPKNMAASFEMNLGKYGRHGGLRSCQQRVRRRHRMASDRRQDVAAQERARTAITIPHLSPRRGSGTASRKYGLTSRSTGSMFLRSLRLLEVLSIGNLCC